MTLRLVQRDAHDDRTNAWSMARYLAGSGHYIDYSERTAGFATRRELPGATGVLIFNLGDAVEIVSADGGGLRLAAGGGFVAGPHLAPALSRSSGSQRKVEAMLPITSMRRLLGVPLDRMLNSAAAVSDILPGMRGLAQRLGETTDGAERAGLLAAAVDLRVTAAPELPAAVLGALGLLARRPDLDIAAIAAETGWSRKHLAAQVRNVVGVGPRSWRRLLRFSRLTARLRRGPALRWAELAAAMGYYDQPHMIREFHEFAGMTPREYSRRALPDGGGLVEG